MLTYRMICCLHSSTRRNHVLVPCPSYLAIYQLPFIRISLCKSICSRLISSPTHSLLVVSVARLCSPTRSSLCIVVQLCCLWNSPTGSSLCVSFQLCL